MNIFLSGEDTVKTDVHTKRYFPFRTEAATTYVSATDSGTITDLLFRAYCDGGNSFSSTAAVAITIPSAADMGEAASGVSVFWKSDDAGTSYAVISTNAGAVIDSLATGTGVIGYKIEKKLWGGLNSGCVSGSCTSNKCHLTSGTLPLFGTNDNGEICHSALKGSAADGYKNTLTKVEFTSLLTPVSTHLTTLRGRGGMGSSTQKLFDIFWMWSTTKASADMVSTLNHFLITPATAITDSGMNVKYGFPLNVW